MRTALFVICFLLIAILMLLMDYFNLPDWSFKAFWWVGCGMNVGTALALYLDWEKEKGQQK